VEPSDVSAAILKPFVSEANHWMVEKHGIFQGYFFFEHIGLNANMREQFRGHPHFERTARFCEIYDNPRSIRQWNARRLSSSNPCCAGCSASRRIQSIKDTCHAK